MFSTVLIFTSSVRCPPHTHLLGLKKKRAAANDTEQTLTFSKKN